MNDFSLSKQHTELMPDTQEECTSSYLTLAITDLDETMNTDLGRLEMVEYKELTPVDLHLAYVLDLASIFCACRPSLMSITLFAKCEPYSSLLFYHVNRNPDVTGPASVGSCKRGTRI